MIDFAREFEVEREGEWVVGFYFFDGFPVFTHVESQIGERFFIQKDWPERANIAGETQIAAKIIQACGDTPAISSLDGDILKAFHKGAVSGEVSVKAFPYPPGKYHVVIAVHDGSEHLYRHRMASFRIRPGDKGNWPVPIYLDYEYSGSAKTVAEVK